MGGGSQFGNFPVRDQCAKQLAATGSNCRLLARSTSSNRVEEELADRGVAPIQLEGLVPARACGFKSRLRHLLPPGGRCRSRQRSRHVL
jgi:hypothetical protein